MSREKTIEYDITFSSDDDEEMLTTQDQQKLGPVADQKSLSDYLKKQTFAAQVQNEEKEKSSQIIR